MSEESQIKTKERGEVKNRDNSKNVPMQGTYKQKLRRESEKKCV